MALQHPQHGTRIVADHDLIRAFVLVVAVIGLMLLATAVFGVQGQGPSYEIAPDPAGLAIPF